MNNLVQITFFTFLIVGAAFLYSSDSARQDITSLFNNDKESSSGSSDQISDDNIPAYDFSKIKRVADYRDAATIYYGDNNASYIGVCNPKDNHQQAVTMMQAINVVVPKGDLTCRSTKTTYVMYVALRGDKYHCIDHTLFSDTLENVPRGETCLN